MGGFYGRWFCSFSLLLSTPVGDILLALLPSTMNRIKTEQVLKG
jgi:hypothetical protein